MVSPCGFSLQENIFSNWIPLINFSQGPGISKVLGRVCGSYRFELDTDSIQFNCVIQGNEKEAYQK